MEFLIRLVQVHETFRKPEIVALAAVAGLDIDIIQYEHDVGLSSGWCTPLHRT